jgi:hypothetical protein
MEISTGVIIAVCTTGATALGWLVNKYTSSLGHQIRDVGQAAASAAAMAEKVDERRREDVTALHHALGEHRDRDEAIHREVMQSTNEQTRTLGQIHAYLERALGDRPTREEVRGMVELRQGAKR